MLLRIVVSPPLTVLTEVLSQLLASRLCAKHRSGFRSRTNFLCSGQEQSPTERESETRERERGLKDTKRRKGGVGCGSSEQAAALGLQADNEGSGFLE